MTRINNNFFIGNFKDYKELEKLYNEGMRLPSTLKYSHKTKHDNETYYCFVPTDKRIDGALYLTTFYISDVFELLDATVDFDMEGNILTFEKTGFIINHNKTIKYKYDSEYAYKFQKTQYRSASPYKLLSMLVDDLFYSVTRNNLTKAYL